MSGFTYRLYERMTGIVRNMKAIFMLPKNVVSINKIISKPTYYPDMKRKSKGDMWRENFIWLLRHKELNPFYTSYGLDVKEFRDLNDFISRQEFCVMRNAGNQAQKYTISGHYNYIVLLRDKYVFYAYLASTIGEKHIVKCVALFNEGKFFLTESRSWVEPEEVLVDGNEFVFKILDGECADGVMLVQAKGDVIIAGDHEFTRPEFVQSIKTKNIIVQNVVNQHHLLKVFKTRSVNTIRIVTIKGKSGVVNVFAAFLRLSISSNSFVDNRAKGGLGVGIDLSTGKLMKYGFPHDNFGIKLEEHPLSNIRFDGYQLPYWNETVKLVGNAHKQFYELQSIGWDVVLTEEGPLLLEGNDDWEIGGPQDTYGGLKERWRKLVNA